jgi:Na+/H+ antiporter NhaD/arsenite permease-like protein
LSLAVISLIALAVAILVSCFSRINVGVLSLAFAFSIGLLGGMRVQEVIAGFPSSLFLTLLGITMLFSQARVNGTLDRVAGMGVLLARGNLGAIPILLFFFAVLLSSIGPGNIGAVALLAPVAMTVAGRVGISAFLMAIMVSCGASAGGYSPFAISGVVANQLMTNIGLAGMEWRNYLNTLVAQSVVAFAGYFLLGGLKLFARRADQKPETENKEIKNDREGFDRKQKLTLVVIGAFVVSVVVFRIDLILGCFLGIVILTLLGAADEEQAIRAIPWNVIVMVCGVTLLISIMERSGGMDLFTSILARLSTKTTITGVIAFVTGLVSVYSSSTGVVLPAFLPTVPGLIEKLGGGDALAIASSINVGAFLVDVSPLSTLGALCIANAPPTEDRAVLFNKMLAWGLSMSVAGAIVCFLFFGLLF